MERTARAVSFSWGRDVDTQSRDQAHSAFTAALARLCSSLPARCAALVDGQGETVDYAGRLSPFEIRIAAAEWQIVLDRSRECRSVQFARVTKITVRSRHGSFCVVPLTEGYALIVQLATGAFSASDRAWSEAIRIVCDEAGLPIPDVHKGRQWTLVLVREGRNRRPASLWHEDDWRRVEVIGRYHDRELGDRELGFHVRLENGLETTLVRERLGRWFSDHSRFDLER